MPLQFPTLAEQTISSWNHRGSLVTFAIKAGAERANQWREIILTFDDDTSIVITGRGRGHHVRTELP
jgi:hypothetical protein